MHSELQTGSKSSTELQANHVDSNTPLPGKGVHVIKTEKEWNKTINIVSKHGKDFLVQDAIVSRDEYTHNVWWP